VSSGSNVTFYFSQCLSQKLQNVVATDVEYKMCVCVCVWCVCVLHVSSL